MKKSQFLPRFAIVQTKLEEKIERHCGKPLTQKTNKAENKFNLFFIDLKNGN
jgi:hypothetical protein